MKTLIQILILVSIMLSCKSEEKEKQVVEEKSEEVSEVEIDTFSFNGSYEVNSNPNVKSELMSKLESLADLENNYQVWETGGIIFKESIVYQAIEKLPDISSERIYFEVHNLNEFKSGIQQINFAHIKGTKDLGSKTYAGARVEEIIFNSEESAKKLVVFVNQIKSRGYLWEDIDKSPSSIFNEVNKVYYISSDGWYMKPFYGEIEIGMKN